jgi:hypothetical protein
MADEDICMESPRKKVAYDPDQDPEEKRVLRQKYRVLLKDEEGKNCSGHEKDLLTCVHLRFLVYFYARSPTECQ